MTTRIEDGRILQSEDGAHYDLTDQARRVILALAEAAKTDGGAHSSIDLVSRAAQDIANQFGWLEESEVAGGVKHAEVFVVVQTDDGSDDAWWTVTRELTRDDAIEAVSEIDEVLSKAWGYQALDRLEDSAPLSRRDQSAMSLSVFAAPPGARGPDDPRDAVEMVDGFDHADWCPVLDGDSEMEHHVGRTCANAYRRDTGLEPPWNDKAPVERYGLRLEPDAPAGAGHEVEAERG